MHAERIGGLLKSARKQLNISRTELAHRGGVSQRLVAELERGQRPNVSLESALRLLKLVGVTVTVSVPRRASVEVSGASASAAERAAYRRQRWTGRQISLHDEGEDPKPTGTKSNRLAAVARVSEQAYALAAAYRRQNGPSQKRKRAQ